MQRRKLLVAVAYGQRLRRLDKSARTFGVFFNIHRLVPSACRSAPKAQMQHLHWVSAGRVDIPQPAAVVAVIFRLDANVGIDGENGRGEITILRAVAP
jgi:hypothetical protein